MNNYYDSDVEMHSAAESSDGEDASRAYRRGATPPGWTHTELTVPMNVGPTLSAEGAPLELTRQGIRQRTGPTGFGNNDCGPESFATATGRTTLDALSPDGNHAHGMRRWDHVNRNMIGDNDYRAMAAANGNPVTRFYGETEVLRMPRAGQSANAVRGAHMTVMARSESSGHGYQIDPQKRHVTSFPVNRVSEEQAERVQRYQTYMHGNSFDSSSAQASGRRFGGRGDSSSAASPDSDASRSGSPFAGRSGSWRGVSR